MHFVSQYRFKAREAVRVAGAALLGSVWLAAADLDDCRKMLLRGQYAECIRAAQAAGSGSTWEEEWPLLLGKAQLALGRYPDALATVTNAMRRYRASIPVRLLAHEVFQANGQTERAVELLSELNELGGLRARNSRDAATLVAVGQAALLLDVDPKLALENFFDQAKRVDPRYREAYLAAGELALAKHDYALAARSFQEALQAIPNDPDAHFGLARAYAPSDRVQMGRSLEAVLNVNSNHVPALLLVAEHKVDTEEYGEADQVLAEAIRVNPWHPEAWACRAVLAHLRNQPQAEAQAREAALKFWPTNPRVDHLIGRKLSQKYRFAEGAAYQRQALRFDPRYGPARIQLAQDLLRLGSETEGWQLAAEVHERDGYDVTAYNLVTLRETLDKFQTITNEDFVIRMSQHEAAVYGDRVVRLLQRAKQVLCAKYGVQPEQPTIVEVFPEEKDFAVRTFGMPGNPGFLGVCFGRVVTANSPASQGGHPANWEAVLWHEFCHVITLQLSRNKMPRWLSEGLSVFEERQANAAWGQAMNPRYREMILGGELKPVGKLSAAFMSPKGDVDLQFAYYESSLVVEYLVERFGHATLRAVLLDLGEGMDLNAALARRAAPLEQIEGDFAAFARHRAQRLGPGLDWTRSKGETRRPTLLEAFLPPTNAAGPSVLTLDPARAPASSAAQTNYWELLHQAKAALKAKRWHEAKGPLQKILEHYPVATGADGAYALLAAAHRGLNETNHERAVLTKRAALEDAAPDVYLRLMELDAAAQDWAAARLNAERLLAVNPLIPQPYRYLARATEALGDRTTALQACQRLLLLDPPDPVEVHYRLARLLQQEGEVAAAKRHTLRALEEAPRFRDAQRLLLELAGGATSRVESGPAREGRP